MTDSQNLQGPSRRRPAGDLSPDIIQSDRPTKFERWAPRVAVPLFVMFVIYVLTRPLLWLLGVIPDDAFYYLNIARHIAATGISTFDGINPTNGYHPAWMLLMVACAKLVGGREELLRLALAVGFALHALSALILRRVVTRLTSRRAGAIEMVLWLVNPFPLILDLQVVEAPVYFFLLLLAMACYLDRIDPSLASRGSAPPSNRDLIITGIAFGLAALGRTEAAILAAVMIVYVAVRLRAVAERRPIGTAIRAAAVMGTAVSVVMLPWFLFSLRTVGSLGQDSGGMKFLWAAREQAGLGVGGRSLHLLGYLYNKWLGLPASMIGGTPRVLFAAGAAVVAAALLFLITRYRGADGAGPLRRFTVWTLAGTMITGTIYGLLLTDSQVWHVAQPGLIIFLLLTSWSAVAVGEGTFENKRRVAGWLLCTALALLVKLAFRMPVSYPWQRQVYLSQPRFEERIPAAARIGCFNAGIPAYFSDRAVINLDGLVNHAVVPYWREHRFDRYLVDAGIGYVIDESAAIGRAQQFSAVPLPLHAIDSAAIEGFGDSHYRLLMRAGE